MEERRKSIVITGRPSSGKSTLISKLVKRLEMLGFQPSGVITPEMRKDRSREGFYVKGIRTKKERVFAIKEREISQTNERYCKHGKYIVFPERFEEVLLEEIEQKTEVFILDEVGPMELGCSKNLDVKWLKEILNLQSQIVITVKKELAEKLKNILSENFDVIFRDIDKDGFDLSYITALEKLTGTEAFLIDLDGVIIDSSEFHKLSWFEVMKKRGAKFTEDDFKETFGMTNELIIKKFIPNATEDEIKKISEEKEEIYRNLARGKIKPIEGANELLEFLWSKGFKMALVSSTPKENIDFISDELGIGKFFDVVISGSDISKGKPDPECYIKAIEKLKVKPSKCYVIEDSQHGIEAGKRAGAKCIGVLTTHKDLYETDIKVENFQELKSILEEVLE